MRVRQHMLEVWAPRPAALHCPKMILFDIPCPWCIISGWTFSSNESLPLDSDCLPPRLQSCSADGQFKARLLLFDIQLS